MKQPVREPTLMEVAEIALRHGNGCLCPVCSPELHSQHDEGGEA